MTMGLFASPGRVTTGVNEKQCECILHALFPSALGLRHQSQAALTKIIKQESCSETVHC